MYYTQIFIFVKFWKDAFRGQDPEDCGKTGKEEVENRYKIWKIRNIPMFVKKM